MQIPGSGLASRQIILLGTINWFILLNLNPIPHTAEFKTTAVEQKQSGRTSTPTLKSLSPFSIHRTITKRNINNINSFVITDDVIHSWRIYWTTDWRQVVSSRWWNVELFMNMWSTWEAIMWWFGVRSEKNNHQNNLHENALQHTWRHRIDQHYSAGKSLEGIPALHSNGTARSQLRPSPACCVSSLLYSYRSINALFDI